MTVRDPNRSEPKPGGPPIGGPMAEARARTRAKVPELGDTLRYRRWLPRVGRYLFGDVQHVWSASTPTLADLGRYPDAAPAPGPARIWNRAVAIPLSALGYGRAWMWQRGGRVAVVLAVLVVAWAFLPVAVPAVLLAFLAGLLI